MHRRKVLLVNANPSGSAYPVPPAGLCPAVENNASE